MTANAKSPTFAQQYSLVSAFFLAVCGNVQAAPSTPMAAVLHELQQQLPESTEVRRLSITSGAVLLQALSADVPEVLESLRDSALWSVTPVFDVLTAEGKREVFQVRLQRTLVAQQNTDTNSLHERSAAEFTTGLDRALGSLAGDSCELVGDPLRALSGDEISVQVRMRCRGSVTELAPVLGRIEHAAEGLSMTEVVFYQGSAPPKMPAVGALVSDVRFTLSGGARAGS